MAGHLQIARTDGAKAGFRAWVAKNAAFGEGTPQYAKLQECLDSGNKRDQFNWYCETFLSTTQAVVEEKAQNEREALIASLLSDEDEGEGVQVVADDDKPGILGAMKREVAKRSGNKRSTTRKSSGNAFGLPVGTTFVYVKTGTKHVVVGTGKTKRGKDAIVARNPKGKERPWNVKSVATLIENGGIVVK